MIRKKTNLRKHARKSSPLNKEKKTAESAKRNSRDRIRKNEAIGAEKKLTKKIDELAHFASFPLLNPHPLLEVDFSGKITFCNDAAKKILQKFNLRADGRLFLPRDFKTILKNLDHKKGKKIYREVTIRDSIFGEYLYFVPEFHAVRIYAHDMTEKKKIEEEMKRAEMLCERERDFTSAVLSTAGALVIVLDVKGRIVSFNRTCEKLTGYSFDEVRGRPFWDFLLIPGEVESVKAVFRELKSGQLPNRYENDWVAKDGTCYTVSWSNTALLDSKGNVEFVIGTGIDITARKKAEDALMKALNESQQRQKEISALLQGSSAVLQFDTFSDTAQAIFDSCKNVTGAVSGYIAMVSEDGTKNEVIYLDSGNLPCSVDPDLPMPIRGMRGEVFSTGKTIYHNDFPRSGWLHFLPEGHVELENVLMAPMVVQEKVVGLFGLANKTGGFTDNDVRIASAFSEFAAIALVHARADEEIRKAKDALQKSNEELEIKVQERTTEIRDKANLIDALFKHTITPLVLLDRDFNFLRVNKEYAKVCSKEVEEFYGHNHFEFYPHEENEAIFKRVVQTKTPFQAFAKPFSFPEHPEWGITYWDWTLTPLLDESGELNCVVFSLNDVTERKKAEDELRESQEKLRNLYAHLQSAVEAERTSIAREIHDEFGTILTALNIDLSWLEKKLPRDQHALLERINNDIELTNSAVNVVQRIASELRPGVLDYLGLSSAVEWQVKEFASRTGIGWDISVDMRTSDLSKEISIALFRILQESLTNVSRYARANKIKVTLRQTDNTITLEVADDGRGITEKQLSDPRSFGILGMKERIQYLGGVIDIRGAPNKGTILTVKVPLASGGMRND